MYDNVNVHIMSVSGSINVSMELEGHGLHLRRGLSMQIGTTAQGHVPMGTTKESRILHTYGRQREVA